jgi:outer membrane receptor for ferrienterochelin and colicins
VREAEDLHGVEAGMLEVLPRLADAISGHGLKDYRSSARRRELPTGDVNMARLTSLLRALALGAAVLGLLCLPQRAWSQTSIHGQVLSGGQPVPSARVAVKETVVGTTADEAGRYRLSGLKPGRHTIVVSALGYSIVQKTVTLGERESRRVDFELPASAVALDPVVVTGTMKQATVSESTVKVDVVPAAVLQRNATNNIMESIQSVNGLYQQVDCGVCYTNNIRINGMEGPYTAVLIDGMPIMSALASVYGLNGINPSIVQQIEIIKGPSSTLYGTEAMGGVVNVITKNPRFAPRFTIDSYRTSHGQTNLDFSVAPGVGPLRGLVSGNLYHTDTFVDENRDGFSDLTLDRRMSLFGKMDYRKEEKRILGLTAKYYYEDRFGGVEGWTKADRGSGSIYGESIYTNRFELLGSYLLPVPSERFRADFSYTWHDQDSYYGDTPYAAKQNILFGNLIWDPKAGKQHDDADDHDHGAGSDDGRRHDLLLGTSLRYQTYDDNTPATLVSERRFIPGVFVQDDFSATENLKLLGGMRLDHHAEHGLIFSPRASLKWEPFHLNTIRLNAGTGFRVVNLFTEDHAALTGARQVVIAEALEPERSYSAALNVNQELEFGPSPMMIDLDVFYTHFTNKIVPDYEVDPNQIVYANLRGYSVSRGVSLSLNQNVNFERFLYNLGVSFQDVYSVEEGVREKQLFAPTFTGTAGFTWLVPISKPNLTVDYTGTLTGPMRLPEYEAPFQRPDRSRTYSAHNVQATLKLDGGVQVYGAVKNLFDFTQGSPLVDPGNPFGDAFDTAYVWGPIQGRRFLLGARFGLSR